MNNIVQTSAIQSMAGSNCTNHAELPPTVSTIGTRWPPSKGSECGTGTETKCPSRWSSLNFVQNSAMQGMAGSDCTNRAELPIGAHHAHHGLPVAAEEGPHHHHQLRELPAQDGYSDTPFGSFTMISHQESSGNDKFKIQYPFTSMNIITPKKENPSTVKY